MCSAQDRYTLIEQGKISGKNNSKISSIIGAGLDINELNAQQ